MNTPVSNSNPNSIFRATELPKIDCVSNAISVNSRSIHRIIFGLVQNAVKSNFSNKRPSLFLSKIVCKILIEILIKSFVNISLKNLIFIYLPEVSNYLFLPRKVSKILLFLLKTPGKSTLICLTIVKSRMIPIAMFVLSQYPQKYCQGPMTPLKLVVNSQKLQITASFLKTLYFYSVSP